LIKVAPVRGGGVIDVEVVAEELDDLAQHLAELRLDAFEVALLALLANLQELGAELVPVAELARVDRREHDHIEVLQAEEVELREARLLNLLHLCLCDDDL